MAERDTYISREEAIQRLYDLIGTGTLKDDLEDDLEEIAALISYEQNGEHLWGQPYESDSELRVAYRDDLWTDELLAKAQQQHANVRFIPAPNEVDQLREYYFSIREIDESSDADEREQVESDFIEYYGLNSIS